MGLSKFSYQKVSMQEAVQEPLFSDVELQTLKEMETVCQAKQLSLSELVKKLNLLIEE